MQLIYVDDLLLSSRYVARQLSDCIGGHSRFSAHNLRGAHESVLRLSLYRSSLGYSRAQIMVTEDTFSCHDT